MELDKFLNQIAQQPDTIEFTDTMAIIEQYYHFTPSAFTNGDTVNEADQNNGSCKIFAFGLLNTLSPEQTLACFGTYYRNDVVNHPDADDHQNIRNFMVSGWKGIQFDGQALTSK